MRRSHIASGKDPRVPINIVIAEDNDDLRAVLPVLFDDAPGFRCAGATAYLDEIAPLLAQHGAQVAVVDIELRGGSSLKLLPTLRSEFPATKFIVHSGHSHPDLIRAARESGADAYVLKSGDFDELLEVIRSLLPQP